MNRHQEGGADMEGPGEVWGLLRLALRVGGERMGARRNSEQRGWPCFSILHVGSLEIMGQRNGCLI